MELDSITGRIAKQLYPQADVQIKGFEKTDYPNDFFDVAIGNVPFRRNAEYTPPVSYTHLDVYKRQASASGYHHINNLCIQSILVYLRLHIRIYRLFNIICTLSVKTMKPVSYTHLDVYKRQE